MMRRALRAGVLGMGVLGLGLWGAGALKAQSKPAAASANADKIARGKYLMTIGACNDCHSPKLDPQQHPDPKRPFSGRPQTTMAPSQNNNEIHASLDLTAWAGPWGVSYTANLTPDQNTGLGIWTEEMFLKAIRTGRHMGVSREILPPMPWPSFRNATDEDLKSIYAYLRSIKPIVNHVPDAQLAPAPVAD